MKKLNMFQYRWDLFLMAGIYRSKGSKFVTLQNHFNISRGVLKNSLERLIKAQLIMPNPGYGHPMRPEYILTPPGKLVGSFCDKLLKEGERYKIKDIFLDKWSCPIIFNVGKEKIRFNELKKALSPITSRALSGSLKSLYQNKCLKRGLLETSPPAHIYSLGKSSTGLLKVYNEYWPEVNSKILI